MMMMMVMMARGGVREVRDVPLPFLRYPVHLRLLLKTTEALSPREYADVVATRLFSCWAVTFIRPAARYGKSPSGMMHEDEDEGDGGDDGDDGDGDEAGDAMDDGP